MKNIVLIGMPGVGKSSTGVVIAKILGFQFLDADLLIQSKYGDILEHLIEKYGIEGFIKIENEVNMSIEASRTVIATGGSVCYCDEALEKMKAEDVIIYLKADFETIKDRLGSLKKRGVVIRKGETLKDLYDERVPLYEKYADVAVDVSDCAFGASVDRTIEALKVCEKFND